MNSLSGSANTFTILYSVTTFTISATNNFTITFNSNSPYICVEYNQSYTGTSENGTKILIIHILVKSECGYYYNK